MNFFGTFISRSLVALRLAENSLPWRVSLFLELTYSGWSLIRESITKVLVQVQGHVLFNNVYFFENYLPLVLAIYAVVCRTNNFNLYVSTLKRIWLMFLSLKVLHVHSTYS